MATFSTSLKRARAGVMDPDEAPPVRAPASRHPQKMQFHGTWSHTDRPGRKAPKHMPKETFGALVVRLLTELFQALVNLRSSRVNRVVNASVFSELHTSGEVHYPWWCCCVVSVVCCSLFVRCCVLVVVRCVRVLLVGCCFRGSVSW